MRVPQSWASALLVVVATLARVNGRVCLSTSTLSNGYLIAKMGETTEILTSSYDAPVVHHTAASFASDLMHLVRSSRVVVRNVTSASIKMLASQKRERTIIFGSINGSGFMRELVAMDRGVAKEVQKVQGKWESWVSVELSAGSGVVVMGSDKRGAAYALYTLSEELGVSPWKWFADVKPTMSHSAVYYSPSARPSSGGDAFGSTACSHGPPLVKYRGIFLNDEAPALTNWARTHFKGPFPPKSAPQSFNDALYMHVFELLLRLKANLIWPAMWSDSFAVAGLRDLPNRGINGTGAAGPNQKLADRMGIVFGTSHQEPMARNTPEWNTWYQGPWDYATNTENITTYWKYGVQRAQGLDTMFTMSMRGNGDKALAGANMELLQHIMAKQKSLLPHDDRSNSSKVTVPMIMCLYTEVQGYYDQGLQVPEDITLLWTDDNYGFIRRIPTEQEKTRSGGAGLYYHADYVGPPRSYKWINTVNLINAWEQLNVAFLNGQTHMFMLNVGDLKPVEVPIHFTLSMAYDNSHLGHASNVSTWLDNWAIDTFGKGDGDQHLKIAQVVSGYSWLNSRIKPELVNATTWSSVHYGEAESVLSEWERLVSIVQDDLIPYFRGTRNWDAFYQLVAYPTLASANLNRMYVAVGRNMLAGTQAKNSANSWARTARELFQHDAELTAAYHALADGKWQHMMAQPHMGSQYWQQPMRNTVPPLSEVQVAHSDWPDTAMGSNIRVSVDASMGAWPGDNQYNCADGYNCPDPSLEALARYDGNQKRSIWVSTADSNAFSFSATTNVSWLHLDARLAWSSPRAATGSTNRTQTWTVSPATNKWFEKRQNDTILGIDFDGGGGGGGNFDDEVEVLVDVDWSHFDLISCIGTSSAARMQSGLVYINTTSAAAGRYVGMSAPTNVTVTLSVDPCTLSTSRLISKGTFVSSTDGAVSMLAKHATIEPARNASTRAYLELLPGYGLLGSAVTVLPPTADSIPVADGPSLAFDFFDVADSSSSDTSAWYNVTLWLSPILNYRAKRPLRYLLELDNDPASRILVTPVPDNITPGTNSADWANVISANIRKVTTLLQSNRTTAVAGKHMLRWWPLEPGLVLEKVVVEPKAGRTPLTSLGMPESGRVAMV